MRVRRDVLPGDAVDVGLGDGLDPGLVAVELVVGQLVGDQDRDLAGDAEGRLEPAGEAQDRSAPWRRPARRR